MSRQSPALKVLGGLATAGAVGLGAYLLAIQPWHRRWGATDEEVARAMLGDELVSAANFETTRAITIHARPEQVWPWLVQIGQGRGGFYSYDWLENLMDLNIHSAGRVLPECQSLEVGDTIALEPEGSGYTVAALEPNHYLVLETQAEGDGVLDEVFRAAGAASTWTFLLEELDDGGTRLVARWRARWHLQNSPLSFLIGVTLDPIEFLMEQKMLRGIKQRAEAAT